MEPGTRGTLVVMLAAVGLIAARSSAEGATEAPAPSVESGETGPALGASLLPPGTTVRVFWRSHGADEGRDLEGVVVGADEVSLQVRDDDRLVEVPWAALQRLEAARSRRHDWKWLAIGTGAGVVVGVILNLAEFIGSGCTFTSCPDDRTEADADRGIRTRMGISVAGGMAMGFAISVSRHRPTGWTDVPLKQIRIGVAPVVERRGYGLTLAVGF